MPILYDRLLKSQEKNAVPDEPSGFSYDKKLIIIHNLRARITCNDSALRGLLTFVDHKVVKEGHPMFNSIAYTNGDKMFFADKFFTLEIPVQCATILHEMFHIVFRHVNRGRRRIHTLWNIATDAIINESIGFKEGQVMEATQHIYFIKEWFVNLDSLYEEFNIPPHEQRHYNQWTSEELYEFLIKKLEQDLEEELKQQQEQEEKEEKDSEGEGESEEVDEEVDEEGDPNVKKGKKGTGGEKKPKTPKKTGIQGNTPGNNQQGDDPESESRLDKIEKRIQDILDKLRKKHQMMAGDDMKEGQATKEDVVNDSINDAIWTQRYNRAKAQSHSSTNSILGRVNPDVYKPQIPWYKELRNYLVKRCMPLTENSWLRPSRRLPGLRSAGSKTYLPGIQNVKGLDKLMVIIDTSGSCFNEEELTMFCTEIQSIQESTNVELALIFADTEIRAEFIVKADGTPLLDKIKKGWVKPAGGGGTDMITPYLEGCKKYKPMLTVIASDGCFKAHCRL